MSSLVKRFAVGATAALALAVTVPAGAAFAAGHVACNGRTDFVRLHLATGNPWDGSDTACFANAGAVGVDLSAVGRIDSGNNVVTVYWDGGRTDLGRWQGVDTNFVHARQVVIY